MNIKRGLHEGELLNSSRNNMKTVNAVSKAHLVRRLRLGSWAFSSEL
jgi:hypothetical protein